jgi:quinol monooxygenase YgiN
MNLYYVLIIHEVADYVEWKKVFDNATTIRKNAGEISFQVLKYENQPNKIVHYSQWTSIENAKQFFESKELIEIREKAGVKSPNFIYLNHLESGIL